MNVNRNKGIFVQNMYEEKNPDKDMNETDVYQQIFTSFFLRENVTRVRGSWRPAPWRPAEWCLIQTFHPTPAVDLISNILVTITFILTIFFPEDWRQICIYLLHEKI